MKVLIVKASALGDVVHALPVLAWLKSADAAMEIDWLVERSFVQLLEGHPLLRRIVCLDTRGWRKQGAGQALRGFLEVTRQLRSARYDVVLDLQGNSKSGLFTLLSGASLRYGFDRGDVREWPNLLASNRKVSLAESDFHITDRSLAISKAAFPAGTEVRTAGPLPVDGGAAGAVKDILDEAGLKTGPLVILHYGTTWVTKLWPLVSWQALAGYLINAHGLQPVLTWGSESELAAVRAIQEANASRCFIWPRGSIKELIALLDRADLVVGGDTGPIHIAAAVGTSTVSIFRVTDASRNAPRGKGHVSLSAQVECAPCLRKSCDLDPECGQSVTVAAVIEAVEKLLGDKPS
jgi:heptosyltransferase-1